MYSKVFKEIADQIDNLRMEIYSSWRINIDDADDKCKLDDMLFRIQSELRYQVKEILECYEEDNTEQIVKEAEDTFYTHIVKGV